MTNSKLPQNQDLSFLKDTVYTDLRNISSSAYRDIKVSLLLKTSSDIIYYLKKHSSLLNDFDGNELVRPIIKGIFSDVYLLTNSDGEEIVVKRSHDGLVPVQISENLHIPIPRSIVKIFTPEYDITSTSLRRDVYDYERIIKPFWGSSRKKITSQSFLRYLNFALNITDSFIPEFKINDLYDKEFWKKQLNRDENKKLDILMDYLKSIENQKSLIPQEERFVLYDQFSKKLQTIIIQKAIRGKQDLLQGKKMVHPFEMVSNGIIPKEMPKLMLEHLLRPIESFVAQLDFENNLKKVPDFRPMQSWKIFPPTPYEMYFAETNNLVVLKNKNGHIEIDLVDTHLLLDPEVFLIYKWVERRYWMSLFLNLRFWVRKSLEFIYQS